MCTIAPLAVGRDSFAIVNVGSRLPVSSNWSLVLVGSGKAQVHGPLSAVRDGIRFSSLDGVHHMGLA